MVEVERLREALRRRPRLEERLFTPAERDWCRRRHDPVPGFAVRMAAKEAVGKLLGTGVTSWQDIEVLPGVPPRIALYGRAAVFAREQGVCSLAVSLTHGRTVAAASAVATAGVTAVPAEGGRGTGISLPAEPGGRGGQLAGHGAEHVLRLRSLSERPHAFTPGQVRELDRRTIEEVGVPGALLMERAALGLTAAVLERYPERHALVVCGRGNNGGDGLAAARQLHLAGHPVVCVVAASSPEELSPDAALQLRAAEGAGVNLRLGGVPDYLWLETELVIDCLLGTGAGGELREPYKTWAEKINLAGDRGVPVLACDIPTGVDSADGSLAEGAVAASLTVTFHAAKTGIVAPPGAEAAGEVLVWDIGLPRWLEPDPDVFVVTEAGVRLPGRRADDHKYRAGFVVVVAGSAAFPGAALLAAGGAGRAGAGYVRLLSPGGAVETLRAHSLEAVVREAGPGEVFAKVEALREGTADESISALVIGPGVGRAPETGVALRGLVAGLQRPAIIDADGLLAFAGRAEELRRVAGLVLTPHTGELAALLREPIAEVKRSHLAAARRGARATGQVLLLKGSTSVVAAPEGETWVIPGGGPQMASAGTGDVLSGVIGAFLARGMEPLEAAKAGAWVHAEAGRRASAGRRGGLLAGDLLETLPAVVSERTYERRPGWRT